MIVIVQKRPHAYVLQRAQATNAPRQTKNLCRTNPLKWCCTCHPCQVIGNYSIIVYILLYDTHFCIQAICRKTFHIAGPIPHTPVYH